MGMMDLRQCACEEWFTPNSYRQIKCNACRFAPHPHPRNKLRESDVIVIRQSLTPDINLSKLGREYGVHPSNICHIKARRTWKHVS
jgi:hypothetical protein